MLGIRNALPPVPNRKQRNRSHYPDAVGARGGHRRRRRQRGRRPVAQFAPRKAARQDRHPSDRISVPSHDAQVYPRQAGGDLPNGRLRQHSQQVQILCPVRVRPGLFHSLRACIWIAGARDCVFRARDELGPGST